MVLDDGTFVSVRPPRSFCETRQLCCRPGSRISIQTKLRSRHYLSAYVGNDPVNFTDPSGLEEEIIVIGTRDKDKPSKGHAGNPGFTQIGGSGGPAHALEAGASTVGPPDPEDDQSEPPCPAPPGTRYKDPVAAGLGAVRAGRARLNESGAQTELSFRLRPHREGGTTFTEFLVGDSDNVPIGGGVGDRGSGHLHMPGGGDTLSRRRDSSNSRSTFRGDVEQMRDIFNYLESKGQDVSDYVTILGGGDGNVYAWRGRNIRGRGTMIGRDQCPR